MIPQASYIPKLDYLYYNMLVEVIMVSGKWNHVMHPNWKRRVIDQSTWLSLQARVPHQSLIGSSN